MSSLVFVLCPSVRARAYLQRSLHAGHRPDLVVRLGGDEHDVASPDWRAPADQTFDPHESLRATIDRHALAERHLDDPDVNGEALVETLRAVDPDLAVFTGGGILRPSTVEAARAWLHVHPGRLPDRRGSTCIHYGLLLDGVVEASAILMRAGLDAGPVLHSQRFPVRPEWTAAGLDDVDDAWIRSEVLLGALDRWPDGPTRDQSGTPRTFYVIHPVLKHLALRAALDEAAEGGAMEEATDLDARAHLLALVDEEIDLEVLAPLVDELERADDARTTWVLPGGTQEDEVRGERLREALASRNARTVAITHTTPGDLEADVALSTRPDDEELPAAWRFEELASHARLVHLPRPPEFFGGDERRGVDTTLASVANRILGWSETQRARWNTGTATAALRYEPVGCPVLDAMTRREDRGRAAEILGRPLGASQKLVVWCPTHVLESVRGSGRVHPGASTFLTFLPTWIDLSQKRDDLVLAIRLDPRLRSLAAWSGELDRTFWAKFDRLVRDHPGLVVHDDPDPGPLLRLADALVGDPSRTFFRFLGTGRPACLTYEPRATSIDPDLRIVEAGATAVNPAELVAFVHGVLAGGDRGVEERTAALRDDLGPLDGRAAARAADVVRTVLRPVEDEAARPPRRSVAPLDFFVLQNVTGAGFALYHYLAAHPQLHLPHRDDCDRLLIDGEEHAYLSDPENMLADPRIEKTGFMVHCKVHLREDMPGRIAAMSGPRPHLLQLVRDPRAVVVASHRRHILANVTDRMARRLGRPGVVGAQEENPTHEQLATTVLPRMRFFAEAQRYREIFDGEWTVIDALDLWPENVDATMRELYARLDVDPDFSSPLFHKDFHGQATKMLHFSQQEIRIPDYKLLVRFELTRDLPHAPGGFARELARVDGVAARLSMPFPDTPVSLAMTDTQYRRLTPAVQHLLVRERRLQKHVEEVLLPAWIEQVEAIHHEVMALWQREIDPDVERMLHRELDADFERLFRHRPSLEERWGWFAAGHESEPVPAGGGQAFRGTSWSSG